MRGLITSVETLSEPLIASIENLEPEVICFYTSREDEKTFDAIGRESSSGELKKLFVTIDDPLDFNHCFEKANQAVDILTGENVYPNETLLDYTGGSKVMSSALVAATLGKGFRYALISATFGEGYRYVYMGENRQEGDGSSYIEGGMEEVLASTNPWEVRALESKRKIQRNFNNYRFQTVIDYIDSLQKEKLHSDRVEYLLKAIRELAEGYFRWDRFHYKGVKEKLQKSTEDFATYRDLAQTNNDLTFSVEETNENIRFLSELQEETFGFDFEKRIGRKLVTDMFWNATRRGEEGKYDDATVRLYRTVEMFGQVEIYEELGHHTDSVPLELIPEKMRPDLNKKADEEAVELGLKDNFVLLSELGNEVGQKYLRHEDELKKVMRTRNTSFLTHNYKSIEKDQFESLRTKILEIFEIRYEIKFPELNIV